MRLVPQTRTARSPSATAVSANKTSSTLQYTCLHNTMIESKRINLGSLITKCFFDCIILALALGAVASAGIDRPLLTSCKCVAGNGGETVDLNSTNCADLSTSSGFDGNRGTDCEILNAYRMGVLSGGLIFLASTVVSTVEFAWVTKKALLKGGEVLYFAGTEKLHHTMFMLMTWEFSRFNAFAFRVPIAVFNWLKYMVSPIWMISGKQPLTSIMHYFLSLPSMCLPVVLILMLYVLIRDASNPVECFSYAASLQIYAFFGNLLVGEIFKREFAVGTLLRPFTTSPGSREEWVDSLITRLAKVAGTKRWAEIEYHGSPYVDHFDFSEREYTAVVAECALHIEQPVQISFVNFYGERIFDNLLKIMQRLPRGSRIRFVGGTYVMTQGELTRLRAVKNQD